MSNLAVIQYQGLRLLMTTQMAEAYGTEEKRISENFSRNKERYTEGKHFIFLQGDLLKSFKEAYPQFAENLKFAPILYLWTEKGAWLHAKSLNTDRAWDAYEMLVDEYYRMKEQDNVVPMSKDQALVTVLRTTADLVEGHQELKTMIEAVDKKVNEQITLQHHEQRALQQAINRRVYELAGRTEIQQLGFDENNTIVADVDKVKKKLFSQMHRSLKDCFAVASYRDIRRCDFKEALKYIEAWRPRLAA